MLLIPTILFVFSISNTLAFSNDDEQIKQIKESCLAAPNCHVRNRHPCIDGKTTCGPCFDGFVADVSSEWANTPCEAADKTLTPDDVEALEIPTIDLAPFSQDGNDPKVQEARKIEAEKVFRACTGPGFLYVINHGIDKSLVSKTYDDSQQFFDWSMDEKMKYAWSDPAENSGYVRVGHEALDEDNLEGGDPKESYDMNKAHLESHPHWSKTSVAKYWTAVNHAKELVLHAFSQALGMPDASFLIDSHNEQWNTLRLLHYPGAEIDKTDRAHQSKYRAGPHSDYGSLTLLLQDEIGGLEVFHREYGIWVPVPPKENTMVVNVADLFMRWTNDEFASTLHRVVVPESARNSPKSRFSIVYFVNPNQEFVVDPKQLQELAPKLGKDKNIAHYEPISALKYLVQRLSATYKDEEEMQTLEKDEL